MHISSISVYPIKSTNGLQQDRSLVTPMGFAYDRHWGIFNSEGKIMTGREYPQLLDIEGKIDNHKLIIKHKGLIIGQVTPSTDYDTGIDLKIFSYDAYGSSVDRTIDQWFSDFLGETCQILEVNTKKKRPVLRKHGGQDGDIVGFNDQAPVLIIGEESLIDLNSRMDVPLGMERFRPNLVVEGVQAYGEDQWDIIKIGDVSFRVIQQCERCVFTTIDAQTKKKHPDAEPLKTMASYRNGPRGGVVFGVHAVPMNSGHISKHDKVTVISEVKRHVKKRHITNENTI